MPIGLIKPVDDRDRMSPSLVSLAPASLSCCNNTRIPTGIVMVAMAQQFRKS